MAFSVLIYVLVIYFKVSVMTPTKIRPIAV
jgi:hypothetical protein